MGSYKADAKFNIVNSIQTVITNWSHIWSRNRDPKAQGQKREHDGGNDRK